MAWRVGNLVDKLILPLRFGETVLERFTLTGAEFADGRRRLVYTFAPSDLQVAVEPRSARPCFTQTPSFNLLYLGADAAGLSPKERGLLDYVASLIGANDPGAVVWESTPVLFLVPGMLGNPSDLSLRAIEVLRRVPTILVEPEKESVTAELLAFHGVELAGKRILPLPHGEGDVARLLEDIVRQDEDSCLFGADEGLPGFNDPGKSLLVAAAAQGERLRVRTVAGPSALAMALLRVPLDLNHFLFLGVQEDPVGCVGRMLTEHKHEPLILFLTTDLAAVVRSIADLCLPRGREIFLVCNLTGEGERVFHLRRDDGPDSLPSLDPTTRAVLIVAPDRSDPSFRGTATVIADSRDGATPHRNRCAAGAEDQGPGQKRGARMAMIRRLLAAIRRTYRSTKASRSRPS